MRNIYIATKSILLSCLLLLSNEALSQYSLGGTPLSLKDKNGTLNQLNEVKKEELPSPNIDSVKQAEKALQESSEKPIPPRFGVSVDVNYTTENSGKWHELANAGKVWRLKIHSPGAKSLNFIFDQYHLPEGARLYIFNPNNNHVLGAFSHKNNKESGKFATDLLKGETAIIEYYEPFERKGKISISKVNYGYKSLLGCRKDKSESCPNNGLGEAKDCHNDVNCQVADDWCVEKRSVGMIINNEDCRVCSGTLLNNTNEDNRLLFLTADHCLGGFDPQTAVYRFFYWSSDCNSGNPVNNFISLSGSILLANRSLNASTNGTDFALLEITDPRPRGISLHFSGWSLSSFITSVSGVHHPNGDLMKYSESNTIGTSGATTNNCSPYGDDFWNITWSDGITAKGSSGSPIFNQNHRVIGQLFGGCSFCDARNSPDTYGRLNISWNYDGLDGELDPNGNNTTAIDHHGPPVYLINRIISSNDEDEYAALDELRIGGEVPTTGNNCQPSGQQFIVENGANATFRAGNTIHIDGGTIIRGGNGGSVTIETGNINCNVRLAHGDFISGPCNAQVSFKKDPIGISDSRQKSDNRDKIGLKIYPNPADEMVNIEKKSFKGEFLNYKLLNSKGQIVKSGTVKQSFASIKVKTLSAGVYLLKTYSEKSQIKTRKMIVK